VKAENQGVIIARASYQDKGANGVPSIRNEQTYVLQAPTLAASDAIIEDKVNKMSFNKMEFVIGTSNGAYIGFEHIDLTNISNMTMVASAPKNYGFFGGTVEIRIDSPDGPIVGTSSEIVAIESTGGAPSIAKAQIKPTQGYHNLYFVFRNPNTTVGQNLFTLINIMMGTDQKAMAMR
jgi:cytochrome c